MMLGTNRAGPPLRPSPYCYWGFFTVIAAALQTIYIDFILRNRRSDSVTTYAYIGD